MSIRGKRRNDPPRRKYSQHGQGRVKAQPPVVKPFAALFADPKRVDAVFAYAATAKPEVKVKVGPTMSEAAALALSIIRQVCVRACDIGAYYWSDLYMQQVCWITKSVLKELRTFGAIRVDHGVVVAKAAA
jgi:hypothetical protein